MYSVRGFSSFFGVHATPHRRALAHSRSYGTDAEAKLKKKRKRRRSSSAWMDAICSAPNGEQFSILTVAPSPLRVRRRRRISDILKYNNVLCVRCSLYCTRLRRSIDEHTHTWMRCVSQHISRIKWMIFLMPSPFVVSVVCEEKLRRTHISRECFAFDGLSRTIQFEQYNRAKHRFYIAQAHM